MEDVKTIATSRVTLHLDTTVADETYDLWRLSKPKTTDRRKAYVSCDDMFDLFRGKTCIRGMIRGNIFGYGQSAIVATKHGSVGKSSLQPGEGMSLERIGWSGLDDRDSLSLLLSCLADRADDYESDDYRYSNLDGAYRTFVTIKAGGKVAVTLEHGIQRKDGFLVWDVNVRTFTLASYLRDSDFTRTWPKEAHPRYELRNGRISWVSCKDKSINDENSYLLKSRNGKRKRNMVDALSFSARETKDTKLDALYKALRLFNLSYSDFARLEWLTVPKTESIPISVKGKSLRKPEGKVSVACVDGCERETNGVRRMLGDMGILSDDKADSRIMVIHDAEYYKALARQKDDSENAQDPYREFNRCIATQCVTAETWTTAEGERVDSMRKSVIATALNELKIKQEVTAGSTADMGVYGYFFAIPCENDDKIPDDSIGRKYQYLHICDDGRFEYYDGNGQPSFDMMDFCDMVRYADDMTLVDHKGSHIECVVQSPAKSVAAILDTGVKALPGNLDRLMREIRTARQEAGLPRAEKTAHPRSRMFAEENYPDLLGINIGKDTDGSTLYSIGYQNAGLNKQLPRMVPLRRILTVEGEQFDDAIIDMCNVCWIRSTYLPSVLPWPVKYLREMKLRQSY